VIVGTGVLIPVCLSRSIFAQIVESLHIPRVFLQSMTANNGHFASFTTFEQPQPNKIVKPQAMCKSSISDQPILGWDKLMRAIKML